MTVNVGLGAVAPKAQAKSGNRGDAGAKASAGGFAEALGGGAARRMPAGAGQRDNAAWKLDPFGARHAAPPADAAARAARLETAADARAEGAKSASAGEEAAPEPGGDLAASPGEATGEAVPPDGAIAMLEAIAAGDSAGSQAASALPEALAAVDPSRPKEMEAGGDARPSAPAGATDEEAPDPVLAMLAALAAEDAPQPARLAERRGIAALGRGLPIGGAWIQEPGTASGWPSPGSGEKKPPAAGTDPGRPDQAHADVNSRMPRIVVESDRALPLPISAQDRPPASAAALAQDRPAADTLGSVRAASPAAAPAQDEPARTDIARSRGGGSEPMTADRAAAARVPAATGADASAQRVSVLGYSAAPAPAPAPGPTIAGLVSAMEADPTWRAAAQEAAAHAAQRGQVASRGVNTLRIQLHPAELGTITARLTATGSQLSVEIRTETSDARHRLANDSETIVKALRAVGYDVEKVTIQHAPQNPAGNAQQGAAGRDHAASNQQAQDEAGARERGRDRPGQEGEGAGHGSGKAAAERPGGGLYI